MEIIIRRKKIRLIPVLLINVFIALIKFTHFYYLSCVRILSGFWHFSVDLADKNYIKFKLLVPVVYSMNVIWHMNCTLYNVHARRTYISNATTSSRAFLCYINNTYKCLATLYNFLSKMHFIFIDFKPKNKTEIDYHHHHHHRIFFYIILLSEVLCVLFLLNAGSGESTETRIGTTYDECSMYVEFEDEKNWNWSTKIIQFFVAQIDFEITHSINKQKKRHCHFLL